MAIKVGDKLPAGTLTEMIYEASDSCPVGPQAVNVIEASKGKRIAILAVPGAFTPGCSNVHLPGFVANTAQFKSKKVDEIWCLSVNDAFVMGAWGKDQKTAGKVRMLADGSATYTRALGLQLDANAWGMGERSQRYAMLVDDGTVKVLNIDEGGKVENSTAEKLLAQI
jgi:glutaredoxin/glutathione-dependent peroxiredoxin